MHVASYFQIETWLKNTVVFHIDVTFLGLIVNKKSQFVISNFKENLAVLMTECECYEIGGMD